METGTEREASALYYNVDAIKYRVRDAESKKLFVRVYRIVVLWVSKKERDRRWRGGKRDTETDRHRGR